MSILLKKAVGVLVGALAGEVLQKLMSTRGFSQVQSHSAAQRAAAPKQGM